jgi:hypothetical protein
MMRTMIRTPAAGRFEGQVQVSSFTLVPVATFLLPQPDGTARRLIAAGGDTNVRGAGRVWATDSEAVSASATMPWPKIYTMEALEGVPCSDDFLLDPPGAGRRHSLRLLVCPC